MTDEQTNAVPAPDAAAAIKAAAKPEEWNGRVPLRKKVKAYGDEISELKFREPTPTDIMQWGMPCTLSMYAAEPKVTIDAAVMGRMMSQLASVPMQTISDLDPRDFTNGCWALVRFFTPDL